MRALIQRVSEASVRVDGDIVGQIDAGLLVLLGVGEGDTEEDLDFLVKKISGMRIFADDAGKMNLSLSQINGKILLVSQFTLHADTRKGNRPSFVKAAKPEIAEAMYEQMAQKLREHGIGVETGKFAADMKVSLLNDGPVTIWLDSEEVISREA